MHIFNLNDYINMMQKERPCITEKKKVINKRGTDEGLYVNIVGKEYFVVTIRRCGPYSRKGRIWLCSG